MRPYRQLSLFSKSFLHRSMLLDPFLLRSATYQKDGLLVQSILLICLFYSLSLWPLFLVPFFFLLTLSALCFWGSFKPLPIYICTAHLSTFSSKCSHSACIRSNIRLYCV